MKTLEIRFVRKLKGKEDRFSITIPTAIAEDYSLEPGTFVTVTLQDALKDPKIHLKFAKSIAKCGERGRLIYVPIKVAKEYELKRDTKLLVTLELVTIKED